MGYAGREMHLSLPCAGLGTFHTICHNCRFFPEWRTTADGFFEILFLTGSFSVFCANILFDKKGTTPEMVGMLDFQSTSTLPSKKWFICNKTYIWRTCRTAMREDIQLGQNKIIILGTVHAHQESIDLVRTTILEVRPDYVAVELNPQGLKALESGSTRAGIRDLLKIGVRTTVLSILVSYSNNKKAKKAGVPLMSDMLTAVKTAREIGTNVAFSN